MKATYRVIGAQSVHGHKPGELFERDYDPEQEARHLARKLIEKVEVVESPDRGATSTPPASLQPRSPTRPPGAHRPRTQRRKGRER